MLFNSYVFMGGFLPLALIGFFLAARLGRRAAGGWLVLASLVFYAWWNPALLPLLLISIGLNFGFAELIIKVQSRPRLQSFLLTIAVSLNLLALFYFKYFFTLVESVAAVAHITARVDPIILPLGISFFTFTQIGYLIDVKQGTAKDRGLLNYLLFVTFFPHLIAGPILHNREMMPQFAEPATYRFSMPNFSIGLTIFIIGLFKKTFLADPLSDMVTIGFAHPESLSLMDSWRTVLTYSLQLYFDFSGYSDMAIGLARMFNVRFPLNFDSPLKSQSVVEYWQRWHMTLTRYLNLYLFNPIALSVVRWRAGKGLGTKRADQATLSGFLSMIAYPTFVTMTLIGLWHGAGFQFLVFGLLHACYLTINHARRVTGKSAQTYQPGTLMAFLIRTRNVLLTYLAVVVGMIFFRSHSLSDAFTMLGGMIGLHTNTKSQPFGLAGVVWMIVLYVIVWGLPNVQQIMGKFEPAIGKVAPSALATRFAWRGGMGWAVACGLLLAASLMAMGGTSEFLYFQF